MRVGQVRVDQVRVSQVRQLVLVGFLVQSMLSTRVMGVNFKVGLRIV